MNYTFSDRVAGLTANAIREIFKYLADPEMISFAGGMPNKDALPAKLLSGISESLFRGGIHGILQYGSSEGYLPLRESAVEFVKRRGIFGASIDNSIIMTGGQQGIDLACKIFLNKGDCILVENPTFLGALHTMRLNEAVIRGVASRDDGLDIEDLEEKLKKYAPKLLYVVPTFGNPTGITYSLQKRKKILELALRYNTVILEDDPYAFLRFDGEDTPSIKSMDTDGAVIYNTSFSKIISPGLRCGVVIADDKIISKLTLCKQGVDVHTPVLSQALCDGFLRGGYLDGHLSGIAPIYKHKKQLMKAAIDKYMPSGFECTDPNGGLFIFGRFKSGIDTKKYFMKALENKVAYVAGADFFAEGGVVNTLRLNFSNASDGDIDRGMSILGKVFCER